MYGSNSMYLNNIANIKLTVGPANATIISTFFVPENAVENPHGVISIFSIFNPNIFPTIICPNSCKKQKNITIMYILNCLVIPNIIIKIIIFKSILSFIFPPCTREIAFFPCKTAHVRSLFFRAPL